MSTVESVAVAVGVPLSVLVFLAADDSELDRLGHEAVQNLKLAVFDLMKASA
jgi:hypothetical protein